MVSKLKNLYKNQNKELKKFDNEKFYCGYWKHQNQITKIMKFLCLINQFIGINKACYLHDKDFKYIQKLKLKSKLKIWLWVIIANFLFLFNQYRFIIKEKSIFSIPHRVILSSIFFIITMLLSYSYANYISKNST